MNFGVLFSWGVEITRVYKDHIIFPAVFFCILVPFAHFFRKRKPEKESPPAEWFWEIYGTRYDLSDFINTHPGGEIAIKLGQGRDCTALFNSYHPFTEKHLAVLAKYAATKTDFQNTLKSHKEDKFYRTLCERVKAFIGENKIDIKASRSRRFYYLTVLLGFIASYFYLYLEGVWGSAICLGFFGWLCGSFGHDGSHFAIDLSPTINQVGSLGIGLLTSPLLWYHQHTYAHHSFTNDFHHDPDLHHFTYLRVHPKASWIEWHRFQIYRAYVYVWYVFVVFGSVFWIPLNTLLSQSLHGITDLKSLKQSDWARVSLDMAVFFWFIVIQPFFHLNSASALLQSLSYLTVTGLLYGFFSQVNHLDGDSIAAAENPECSWAKLQVEASNNFCTNSVFWTWISNGLNHQIEHHLFPGINHEKLPLIRDIVRHTCTEFEVKYQCYPTTRSILQATAVHYKKLALAAT